VRYVEQVTGNVVDPVVDADLAAGGAEAGLAGERDAAVELASGADVASIAAVWIAAEHHTFDGFADVGLLIERDLVSEAQVTPGEPVVADDVAEAVVGSGTAGVTPGG
jgi:uncharacterized protein YqfA (UPF0365 family)